MTEQNDQQDDTRRENPLDILREVKERIDAYMSTLNGGHDQDTPTRDEATDAETRGPADEDEQRPRNLLSALRRAK